MIQKNIILLCTFFLISSKCWSQEPMVDLIPYCTYGVVTGALIGAASLALSDDPGSNLSPISKGASLGLYIGSAVGFYKYWSLSQQKLRIDYGDTNEILNKKNVSVNSNSKHSTEDSELINLQNNIDLSNQKKIIKNLESKPEIFFIPDSHKLSFIINWKF